jgi:hypothetical protein
MRRVAWLIWVVAACGDNHSQAGDAGRDTASPVCDPAACPSDTCHAAACVANACALVDISACAMPACMLASGCGSDRDGDGFSDAWEDNDYIDGDCNGAAEEGDLRFPHRSLHVFGDVVKNGTGIGQLFPTVTDPALPIATSTTVVTISTGGGFGTAQFTLAVDGGAASAPAPVLPVVDAPGNLRLVFYINSFVAGDTYTFTTSMGPDVKIADADRPNVYVQYDYMDFDAPTTTTCTTDVDCVGGGATPNLRCHAGFCTHDHFPADPLFRMVVKAYADNGVTLYIDPVHHAVPHATVLTFAKYGDPDTGPLAVCAGADLLPPGDPAELTNGNAVSFFALKNRSAYGGSFDPQRRPVFRYAIFGHASTCLVDTPGVPGYCGACPTDRATPAGQPSSASSGGAELPGNDFMVTLGNRHYVADIARTPFDEGGVFMHELGHTLGLHHAGDNANVDSEPNYLSVMNNKYVYSGIQHAASPGSAVSVEALRTLDYSQHTLGTLDEAHLDTAAGTSPLSSGYTGIVRFFNYAGGNGAGPESGPVQWDGLAAVSCTMPSDCAGGGSLTGTCLASGVCEVKADLNKNGVVNEVMTGYRDWSHTAGPSGDGGGACITSADCRINMVRFKIQQSDPTVDAHEECVAGVCRPMIYKFQCFQWGVADASAPRFQIRGELGAPGFKRSAK